MTIAETLKELLGYAPTELVDYFEAGNFYSRPGTNVRCLAWEAALKYTREMMCIPPVRMLGLFILTDSNDSNPYGYITHGPCAGGVFHFVHDDGARVAFSSLGSFVAALHALPADAWMHELEPETGCYFETVEEIEKLSAEDSREAEFLVSAYLSVTKRLPERLMESFAANEDFLARESLAMWLRDCGSQSDLPFAERLSFDKHPQVARMAAWAVAKINERTMKRV